MNRRLVISLIFTAALSASGLMTSAQAGDCPSGFRFEKLNDTYTCTTQVSYQGNDYNDVKSAQAKALNIAGRAFKRCGGPLRKPEFVGFVVSSRTNTEVGGLQPASGGGETYQVRGEVVFACKLG